jgi:hypothetical protein
LIGVKLFAAIAGVALIGGVFPALLDRSGWLQPPVRVAIGVIVAVALLGGELKSARDYPHGQRARRRRLHLFDVLRACAVELIRVGDVRAAGHRDRARRPVSIRRDSLFTGARSAGRFASPALLSTGENRPIPLFAYLLLLNGLAWVAYRKVWPVLTRPRWA